MKKIFVLCLNLILLVAVATAQETQKSELHQQAESALSNSHPITARYTFVRAYEDYFNKGKFQQGLSVSPRPLRFISLRTSTRKLSTC